MTLVADPSKEAVAFGQRLRELREAAGLSQSALGEAAGMTYQNVARFERGLRSPSWESLLRLASALNVGLDAFQPDGFPGPATQDADSAMSQFGDDADDPPPPPRPMGKRK